MKKSMRIQALVLAALMLCSILCGCDPAPATTAANALSKTAEYTVKVVDPLGNGVSGVAVRFMKNDEQMAMAITDDAGVVVKELDRADYTVQLTFMDLDRTYHVDSADAALSATKTQAQIVVAYEMNTLVETLGVPHNPRAVYTLQLAGSELTITGVRDKTLDGTYTFTADETGLQIEGAEFEIVLNLLKNYTFQCAGLTEPASIVDAEGNAMSAVADGTYTIMTTQYDAYSVEEGVTYVKLNEAGRNFFIFTPKRSGVYEFTVVGEGAVGYYGSPNFVYGENNEEVVDNAFQVTIEQSMIGTNGTGTSQLVIGIDTEQADTNTYLCVTRVGDAPVQIEWTNYISTYKPSKYTLPAGVSIQEFDLTSSYTLVYNENDKYYHLDSADGPVVLVRLLAPNEHTGFAFGNMLLGTNVGTYHYDENNQLVDKVLYNDCLQQYLGNITGEGEDRKFSGGTCDSVEGVYPLTKDLEIILKDFGAYMGYWDSENPNYLFAGMNGLNVDMAWLFACCYVM